MAGSRKGSGRPGDVASTAPRKRRSESAPLWPWGVLGAVLIGFPLVRDATADKMQRVVFSNQASCACAYSAAQCTPGTDGRYVGPWFAVAEKDRRPDDPGRRSCSSRGPSGTGSGYYGTARNGDVRPAIGTETGYRGGFGGTGRVRTAGG